MMTPAFRVITAISEVQSDVMLFVSQKYISVSVLLSGETYGIDLISVKKGSELSENLVGFPLHIIYNENDVIYQNSSIDGPPHFLSAESDKPEKSERSPENPVYDINGSYTLTVTDTPGFNS